MRVAIDARGEHFHGFNWSKWTTGTPPERLALLPLAQERILAQVDGNVPSPHHTQYFEMLGDHAIYHDGWIASTKVMRPPWNVVGAVPQDPASYPYELYDLTKDWTQ